MLIVGAGSNLEIARGITTPIALASLFLLLAFSVIHLLVKGRANQNQRLIIQYGFILAIILSTLANLSYLVVASFQREIRISETVRDNSANPLPRAIVDIAGRGRGITDDYGSFQFIIPDAWSDDQYEAIITLKGYEPQKTTLSGKRPKPINVTLSPQTLTSENLLLIRGNALVRHMIGIPVFEIPLSFANPLGHQLTIDQVTMDFVGPRGERVRLLPQLVRVAPNAPAFPAIQPIIIPPNGSFDFIWSFGQSPDYQMASLAQRADREFMISPYQLVNPDPMRAVYSDDVVRDLKAFMLSHFLWSGGTWSLTVMCSAEGRQYARSFHFALSEQDIQRMKSIADLYGSGIGVVGSWMYWESNTVKPTVIVTLQG